MISLWIVIISFAIIFTGLYFVYKMNKEELKTSRHEKRRHRKV